MFNHGHLVLISSLKKSKDIFKFATILKETGFYFYRVVSFYSLLFPVLTKAKMKRKEKKRKLTGKNRKRDSGSE